MIYREAATLLRAAGVDVHERSFGLEGHAPAHPAGSLRYQIGGSHGGGLEMSVSPPAGFPVRWFFRASVEAMAALLLDAHGLVARGEAPALLEALLAIDAAAP